jgi:hypothetical protein
LGLSIQKAANPQVGKAHAVGFSPTVITDTPKAVKEAGKAHAIGYAPTVAFVPFVAPTEREENRGGGGRYYEEQDERIRAEDEIILEMIREFIRRVS